MTNIVHAEKNNIEIWNDWLSSKSLNNHQVYYLNSIFNFIDENYKELRLEIKWNQPMFIFNKTFIIAFSPYKNHISIALDPISIVEYKQQLELNKYEYTDNLFKIKYDQIINFALLTDMINNQINKKRYSNKFF